MRGLGKGFNSIPLASGLHISLKNASGVTFILYENGGAQSTDFKESVAGSSEQALTFLNDYYAGNGVGGVWTHETADADATLDDDSNFVKKDTTLFDCAVIYVGADELSAGFDCIEATVDAGDCHAIIHDLTVQRGPENLAAMV
ncbi:MAG: hypothetical protein E3J29_06640 [Dehalococcoidia bacterium]|nr:MAG: hypothetical protein E3J29_06640 [Dehalococcoidia bacterium]